MPGSFYRRCQQSLMTGAITGNPTRYDFSPLVDKSLQRPVIKVVDDIKLILTEAANPLPSLLKFRYFVPP